MEFYINPGTLPQKLKEGVLNLLNEVGGNKDLVKKVIDDFVKKTPSHIKDLQMLIYGHDTIGLKDKLHLLKVRYAYLGLKNVMDDMEVWENNLLLFGIDKRSTAFFERFENLNRDIINSLTRLDINTIQEDNNVGSLTILIVDDDEINTLIIIQMLEKAGHVVHHSSNGYQATQLVRQKSFDIVFVDIHMPFFSGIEAIKRIRAIDSKILIVAISASKDSVEVNECLAQGANKFLSKPIKTELLNDVVNSSSIFFKYTAV